MAGAQPQNPNTPLVFPGANSRLTYFSLHNIAAAREISRGEGIKVGILDHSFGFGSHDGLFAGGEDFIGDKGIGSLSGSSHHGYWMALVLREIAPGAEIFALNTAARDEGAQVDAMVRALDWAVENGIRVLTYSSRRISPDSRRRLDEAVETAVGHGIVTTFIHYPHPQNLLPAGLSGPTADDEREPDVNILHYDYTVVFPQWHREHQQGKTRKGWQPFLSISSTSPVTAGIVAMMLSVNSELTPAQCKKILRVTGRPMNFEGSHAPRVVDAGAAVLMALAENSPR